MGPLIIPNGYRATEWRRSSAVGLGRISQSYGEHGAIQPTESAIYFTGAELGLTVMLLRSPSATVSCGAVERSLSISMAGFMIRT